MTVFKRMTALAGLMAFAAACGGNSGEAAPSSGEGTTPAATSEAPAAEAAPAPAAEAAPAQAAAGTVHEVKMVTTQGGASGVFEPANITVKKGDVIRFVNDGAAAHNVSFPAAENAGAANLPPATPYATTAGQTLEVQVSMDPGTYNYQCDPHAPMGMKGQITVQ